MSTVPVSVIIPAFNAERWLERAVTSTVSGDFAVPGEVLIVNDASTDTTVDVANKLAEQFPSVRLLDQDVNGGIVRARRAGLVAARYEWVAHLDADDYLSPGAVAVAYDGAIESGADLCIWERRHVWNGQTSWWPDTSVLAFPLSGREAARLTLGSWRIHAWGVMKGEQWLAAIDAVDVETFSSDELVVRQFLMGCTSVSSCTAQYFWVHNPDSISKSDGKKVRTELLKSHAWLVDFASDNGFLEEDVALAAQMTRQGLFLDVRIFLNELVAAPENATSSPWRRALVALAKGAFRVNATIRSRWGH